MDSSKHATAAHAAPTDPASSAQAATTDPASSAQAATTDPASSAQAVSAAHEQAMLQDLSCAHFAQALAAKTSTPGGGAAAAYSLSLSAALFAMAAEFSTKQANSCVEDARLNTLQKLLELREAALLLMQADADAYAAYRHAAARPKNDPERAAALFLATKASLQPPADIIRYAGQLASLLEQLVDLGFSWNKYLLSDVVGAAHLLEASTGAAWETAAINLSLLKKTDPDYAACMHNELFAEQNAVKNVAGHIKAEFSFAVEPAATPVTPSFAQQIPDHTPRLLKGAPVAQALTEEIKARVKKLSEQNYIPQLAVVCIGEAEDALSYARAAQKRASNCGIAYRLVQLPFEATTEDLLACLDELQAPIKSTADTTSTADAKSTADAEGLTDTKHAEDTEASASPAPTLAADGILLLQPLPAHINAAQVLAALKPDRDIDGASPASALYLVDATQPGFVPCTAQAVLELLSFYGYEVKAKRISVIGRSRVVGLPLLLKLQQMDATVQLCHSKTADLAEALKDADIVVTATGQRSLLDPELFCEGQVVIDAGITFDPTTGKMGGDIVWPADSSSLKLSAYTPVPGGVGAITTAVLMKQLVQAAERHAYVH